MSKISKIAKNKYLEYSKYEGSQHIASEYALYRVLELIKRNSASKVLEVGLGIGTIYSSVNVYDSNIEYYGTEDNEFCLNSLKVNLKTSYKTLKIYSSVGNIPKREKFDVVIIDGKDEALSNIKRCLKEHSVIIIEGDRLGQQKFIMKLFPHAKIVHTITLKRNNPQGCFNVNDYQGGAKVIFINPTMSQKVYWLKNKILTSLKYRIRKLNS